MFFVIFQQRGLVFRQFEEIRVFFNLFYRGAVNGTFAVLQFAFVEEIFTGLAVKTLVRTGIYIAALQQFLEYGLYVRLVVCVGGAYEIIVLYIHVFPQASEMPGNLVAPLLGRNSFVLRGFFYVGAVLVGACLYVYRNVFRTHMPCKNVSGQRCVRVSDMRIAVDVVKRSGYIIFFVHLFFSPKMFSSVMPAFSLSRRAASSMRAGDTFRSVMERKYIVRLNSCE